MKRKWLGGIGILTILSVCGYGCWKSGNAQEAECEQVIHLGAVLEENVSFPEGETVEDNQILDRVQKDLGIRVVYDWIYSTKEFERNIDMHIACDALPEALMVGEAQYLQMLEYGQLQPVTELYEQMVSDQAKAFVESGGEEMLEAVWVDGEMMAIPFPNLTASGINVMWIRKDWLDELGLEPPRTIKEVIRAGELFTEHQMGGEGTVGILGPGVDEELNAVGKCCFGLTPLFSAFHAYPKYWLKDEEGNLIYGSVQKEVREALKTLAELYKEGVLDQKIFLRQDVLEVLNEGKAGIFFGPWWAAERLEKDIIENKSEWQAYGAPLDEDGQYICVMPPKVNQYLVIHQKCQDPEAVIDILNYGINLEYGLRKEDNNINILAYPLGWEYDFADELEYIWKELDQVMQGEEQTSDFSGHKLIQEDMDNLNLLNRFPYDHFGMEDYQEGNNTCFIRLYGIINGVRPIADQEYLPVDNLFSGTTETMKAKWKFLKNLEEQTYAKIILGKEPIEAFDKFVDTWKENGGLKIQEEVNAYYAGLEN